MNMKKWFSGLLCAAMLFGLAACGGETAESEEPSESGSETIHPVVSAIPAEDDFGDVANDPKVTLVYAEVNPLTSIMGQTGSAFKRQVEKLSGGSISIDYQPAGVMGSENVVVKSMLSGETTVDLCRISIFSLTPYGCSKSMLLTLPFTFESRTHWWKFACSDLASQFLNEPQEIGLPLHGIFYGEEGFRHFFTKTPVTGIEDLRGLKLRVSNDPIMQDMVKSFGATPVEVAFNDLYSALNTGKCSGAEQPVANYKSNSFPNIANNLILDGHTLGAVEVVMTSAAWDKLTENQQKVLIAAGKNTQEFNAKLSATQEPQILEDLKNSGCNIVEVPDKTPWKEACAGIIEGNTSGQEELYQQILDMASSPA